MATNRQAGQASQTAQTGGRWWRVFRGIFGGLRGIRLELSRIADAQERMTELYVRHLEAQAVAIQQPAPAKEGDIEVTFVHDGEQELWMECELALTRATGRAPTEEQVLAEYQRRLPAWVEAGGMVPGGVAPSPRSIG